MVGASALHGPHHVAEKSTSTGVLAFCSVDLKLTSVSSVTFDMLSSLRKCAIRWREGRPFWPARSGSQERARKRARWARSPPPRSGELAPARLRADVGARSRSGTAIESLQKTVGGDAVLRRHLLD